MSETQSFISNMGPSTKPACVLEVEADVGTSVAEAWAKLKGSHPEPSEEEFLLFIEASRRERGRWELSQQKKGKEE